MQPKIAVDIVSRDKSDAGFRSSERRGERYAKRMSGLANSSGLTRIGQTLDGLTKFRAPSGLDGAARSLTSIGRASSEIGSGVAGATTKMLAFGAASESTLGAVAAEAGAAAGAIASIGVVVAGAAVGTYLLGEKWAKTGAEIDRTRRTLGVTGGELQSTRAAAERFGVSADATTASIDALGSTLYDAKYGANNLALGALTQLGIKLKTTKDGATDVHQAMLDIADAIARQKDPFVQRKLASVFGMSAMLPALRQGSAALKSEGADYMGTGAALSDAEVAKSADVAKRTIRMRQHLRAIEARAGVAAEGVAGDLADAGAGTADRMVSAVTGRGKSAITSLSEGARDLGRKGTEAGKALVDGAGRAAKTFEGTFDAFAKRIEHQESRGRQFDRGGHPLTSSRGAIGVMQMLPDTAERAAKRAGLAWDPQRFQNDAEYNRALGRAELQRLLEKFDGDQVLAAAAYNAGEGRLTGYRDKRGYHPGWLKTIGDPRKGEISDQDFADRIPFAETRDYVANTAKAHVEITIKGAPAGTVARVAGAPGVDVDMHVARSMDGPA